MNRQALTSVYDAARKREFQLVVAGEDVERAKAAIILVHGRGASAESMMGIFDELAVPGLAAVAPQAPGHTWYPNSFLVPIAANQPYLDSALFALESIVTNLIERGIESKRIAILGFSQGACLTTEFVATHPRRYGAIIALTGGLIGPPGTARNYPGSLSKTPVFLGSSDPDPHVPFERVQETRDVLGAMGAAVELRRYAGMGHTINEDELNACQALLSPLASCGLEKD
ncbi:MAG TPA: dienelactone hydrolase family protein [Tepidisphaeraceae bacterium]|nr:dienelactone hydrolase family protein [Tepidisphaeraceae bacterium]